MPRGLRILHLADTHIGAQLPARPRDAAAWRRGNDFIDSYRRALGLARALDVDLVLHAGDLFDEPAPSDAAIAAAATPLLELAAAGIPVVIVPGNHERSAIPATLLFQHPNLHIFTAPASIAFTLRGRRVVIAGTPCVRRKCAERFPALLDSTGWQAARGEVNILLAHQTFESAVCGTANYRFRSGEDVIERFDIPPGIHYVAAGHVHRHQTLTSLAAPIVYAGSPDRISFAEEHEPKGSVLIEEQAAGLSHHFIEHPVRPMARLPLDVTGRARQALRDEVLAWAALLPQDALAQVRLSGRAAARELRGIALAACVANIRPDLRLDVVSQAVEYVPERSLEPAPSAARIDAAQPAARSAFAALRDAFSERQSVPVDRVAALPSDFGVYALHDAGERLLYVGKATSLRSRVRQHLAARPSGAFFEGWTRGIARIEVRPAICELEALLVEAELIRTLRPPFNRQMRQWERYCYLCEGMRPHGELTIVRDLPLDTDSAQLHFYGPYRSRSEAGLIAAATAALFSLAFCRPLLERPRRPAVAPGNARLPVLANLCERYFAGICMGPCGGRAAHRAYDDALARRAALLRGADETAFAAAVTSLTEQVESSKEDPSEETKAALEFYQILRHAFEHGCLLAEAADLIGTTLQLAGPGGAARYIRLGIDGLEISANQPGTRVSSTQGSREGKLPSGGAIPKALLDALATAVRFQRRQAEAAQSHSQAPAATSAPQPVLRKPGGHARSGSYQRSSTVSH